MSVTQCRHRVKIVVGRVGILIYLKDYGFTLKHIVHNIIPIINQAIAFAYYEHNITSISECCLCWIIFKDFCFISEGIGHDI